jgi:hypothetical protein
VNNTPPVNFINRQRQHLSGNQRDGDPNQYFVIQPSLKVFPDKIQQSIHKMNRKTVNVAMYERHKQRIRQNLRNNFFIYLLTTGSETSSPKKLTTRITTSFCYQGISRNLPDGKPSRLQSGWQRRFSIAASSANRQWDTTETPAGEKKLH